MVKKNIITSFTVVALFLSLLVIGNAEEEFSFEDQNPGKIEGIGTYFELNNSEYLNITLESSEPIDLVLESVPDMITMQIESTSNAQSSQILLSGFIPLTTYYKYEDDYNNGISFITDENGSYVYVQDISQPHLVFIQPKESTIFIRDDATGGDCNLIGIWDSASKTCTLLYNLEETVQIESNNITLDGNGHTITGSYTGYGIIVAGNMYRILTGITIKNLTVENFSYGILLHYTNLSTVIGNTVSYNYHGIYISASGSNTLENNLVTLNSGFGIQLSRSSNISLTSNNISNNNLTGIVLYYSSNNNIEANTISYNFAGIYLGYSPLNTLINNYIHSNINVGIVNQYYNNNTISNNTISNNYIGIRLDVSGAHTITENVVSGNSSTGLYLYRSSSNIISENTFSDSNYGIYIRWQSNNNQTYSNNFINNTVQAFEDTVYPSSGNIYNLSDPVGGNYWSNFDTPEEGCYNEDGNNFCDDPFFFHGGQDNLPLIKQFGLNSPPVADAGIDQTMHVGTLVTLDGTNSYDPDENYPLAYYWEITSMPEGSTALLSDQTAINPTFTADMTGDYIIELVVTDSIGGTSVPDQAQISTYNSPPVADAGIDQAITEIGTVVQLDGTQSYDLDGDEITYYWEITSMPVDSTATLNNSTSTLPTFVTDAHGDYVISLVVTDEFGATSNPDTVTISFENVQPVADAGVNKSVLVGDTVFLDGSGSFDANLDPLTYSWSIVTSPEGSVAELNGPTSVQASFVADLPGNYVLSLVVNDGFIDSEPINVTILAITAQDTTTQTLQEVITIINDLDDNVFKNRNMKNALTNKINATIEKVESGNYEDALAKLTNDIITKTDGCANAGNPDKNDWIKTCDAQAPVYQLIIEAINLLEAIVYGN